MGGAVQKVGQAIGVDKKPSAPAASPAAVAEPIARSGIDTATSLQEQSAARSRSRRRGGRSLLSEARLNAESGVQTLGGGNSLGQ